MKKRSSSSASAYFSAPPVPSGVGSSTYRSLTPKALPSPSTLRTPEAMWPQEMTMSSTPCERSQSSMKAMNGRSTSGTTGLGTVVVSGRSRVPSPPARMSACTRSAPPDALVGEPRAGDAVPVERVAPVDDEVAAHARGHLGPVEVGELRPFGDEHDRVGAVDGGKRRVRELDALHEPARGVLGDGVVGAHPRAVGLQPSREHERGRLAHVVGVGLEREPEQRDLAPDERPEVLLELGDDPPLLQLVNLDDGGQELEVVAGVAGELLEGGDILRETVSWRNTVR